MSTAEVISLIVAGGSLAIAAWAAYTAHAARQWQQERDKERRATRVRVIVGSHSAGPQRGYPFISFGGDPGPPAPVVYKLGLAVINDGEATEFVTAVTICGVADESGAKTCKDVFGSEGVGSSERHELAPRDRLQLPVELDRDDVAWMRRGFTVVASLASGPPVESEVDELVPEFLAEMT